jgi:glycosyltransferase involved in cell wall biosynthesis
VTVLQLTSDWKWTGPAEPMLRLALGLRARGRRVLLAAPRPPDPTQRSLWSEAEAAGLAPALELERARGLRPLADRAEVARLRELLAAESVGVIHAWHTRDHLLALRAAGVAGVRRAPLVRSLARGEAVGATPWNRWLFGPGTDGLLCVSPGAARRNQRLRGGRPVRGAFGAVDLERFHPAPGPGAREALGLGPGHRVLGVVARVQPHRRFELLLEAARRLFREDPAARLLVVGRGTRRAELAERPAARLGISDRVVFAGYRTADYTAVLRAIDVLTFLVPGSDGGCRAVCEAAACGIPAVASRRGALPEIVLDGETGLLVEETPEALVAAWRALLGDTALRQRLGQAAAKRARERFAPERYAEEVEGLYAEVVPWSSISSR